MIKKHKKWQVVFNPFGNDYSYGSEAGWYVFYFGVLKIKQMPREGQRISPKNYKGFLIRFWFWLPFDLRR